MFITKIYQETFIRDPMTRVPGHTCHLALKSNEHSNSQDVTRICKGYKLDIIQGYPLVNCPITMENHHHAIHRKNSRHFY
jgi:hypothetical protein